MARGVVYGWRSADAVEGSTSTSCWAWERASTLLYLGFSAGDLYCSLFLLSRE